ncbi:hypothetical protein [Klebsiella pneumoniae]|uniref:hypothetical protein n=1 Tax=Klebsiella pneumoniae TaxID=573 RepID=UPI002DBA3B7F|nr:hypothetical protein [Klebsiella pneumoniae]MEB6283066.1 hypothetical protein [Klebsiella pneumoniae]
MAVDFFLVIWYWRLLGKVTFSSSVMSSTCCPKKSYFLAVGKTLLPAKGKSNFWEGEAAKHFCIAIKVGIKAVFLF